MKIIVKKERVQVGDRVAISFQRTLRIPEDDQSYPLPPSLGPFTIHKVKDYSERVPRLWLERGGCFIAMYQREALWIGFDGADWKPNAVKVAVGGINAVSGTIWKDGLHNDPQDYVICPDQPWLDGINAGDGFIRQFVAMPLGAGFTVEGQLTNKEEFGGIQFVIYEPKVGIFPDAPPPMPKVPPAIYSEASSSGSEMGIGAGGKITQKIYPGEYGIETWDQNNPASLFVHILNSEQYREITGLDLPLTPVRVETYVKHDLPWFDLYDEAKADLPSPSVLKKVRTIEQLEGEGLNRRLVGKKPVDVEKLPTKKLRPRSEG
jgi:hypothetical protein